MGMYSLNSKIVFSRTLLPKMSLKLGQKTDVKEETEINREKNVVEKIKLLYKSENKRENPNLSEVISEDLKLKRLRIDGTNEINSSANETSYSSPKNIANSNHLNIAKSDCYSEPYNNSGQINITTIDCYSECSFSNTSSNIKASLSDYSNITTDGCSSLSGQLNIATSGCSIVSPPNQN